VPSFSHVRLTRPGLAGCRPAGVSKEDGQAELGPDLVARRNNCYLSYSSRDELRRDCAGRSGFGVQRSAR